MTRLRNNIDLGPALERIKSGGVKGLTLATEAWLTDANTTVPIDEGTLQRSGEASVDEGELKGAVSYDTPYAVKQHEDMTLTHQGAGRAKWLENSGAENGTKYAQVIATAIKSEVEG